MKYTYLLLQFYIRGNWELGSTICVRLHIWIGAKLGFKPKQSELQMWIATLHCSQVHINNNLDRLQRRENPRSKKSWQTRIIYLRQGKLTPGSMEGYWLYLLLLLNSSKSTSKEFHDTLKMVKMETYNFNIFSYYFKIKFPRKKLTRYAY